ncbi:ABC transporter ATP-binding protein [Oceanibacterium hippocampi]|uniref:Spermidine/putrescine import ATP-binding protein PotA n=1 Tax=Oceanibacterium hippocampi TaxID=745714 RepID=A0A1Y5R7Q3_9PROT|nr:ABC transporter ATP-binding protein [Oceanibacterium hippocampi]SLN11105.1 Spermidine/putrescine import ATP-binding protein PotA [Oceanibacterium hippocampi]
MHELALEGVTKRFGTVTAVADVSLAIPGGSFVCFLGPSGCGKTTLLRLIAGLETPSRGRVRLDGQDLTGLPPHRRNIGMVFQSLALFPHLAVGDNVGYGLRIRNVGKAERARRVEELLALVQLDGYGDRAISQLSGGQRQRVAIARALAMEPSLFLLDEPLSALDAKLREAMQVELRQLQQRLGITTIVVTHDQREAMTMSDLIVVMSEARVQQIGPPLEIYRNPANRFVADFIGASNLLTAERAGPGAARIGDLRLAVSGGTETSNEGAVTLLIRPEEVQILGAGAAGPNRIDGTVRFLRDVGASVEIHLDSAAGPLIAVAAPKDCPPLAVGTTTALELPAAALVALDR